MRKRHGTVAGYKVGEVEIEFPDGDVDVVRVDTEAWLSTFRSLFQSLPIRRLQRNRLEEDHHYQIQSPHLRAIKNRNKENKKIRFLDRFVFFNVFHH